MLAELSFSATRFLASETFLLSPSAASRCETTTRKRDVQKTCDANVDVDWKQNGQRTSDATADVDGGEQESDLMLALNLLRFNMTRNKRAGRVVQMQFSRLSGVFSNAQARARHAANVKDHKSP